MQTRIGGLSNKLLISPLVGGPFGGSVDGCKFEDY